MELKNLKTFEQLFEQEQEIDEKFLDSIKDKIAGVKKFILDEFEPSDEAKDFAKRNIKYITEYLKKIGVPVGLITAASMALYDYADGVPLLNKMKVDYDPKENTIIVAPNNDGKKFAGSIVMG